MSPVEPSDRRPRVLLIRPSALGDVARSVPALVTIRQALPDAHIDWLVQDDLEDVVRHHPALNGVVSFPRKKFGRMLVNPLAFMQFLGWSRKLRKSRYDIAIDLQGLARSGLFTFLTRAKERIGYANARELGWLGYKYKYQIDPKLHAVDRMLGLLSAHGWKTSTDTRLYTSTKDQQSIARYLGDHKIEPGSYTILAPTAKWRCKCWPIESFLNLARRLLNSGIAGDRIIILAAPHEKPYVQPLIDALNPRKVIGKSNARILCPQTKVGQMMALIQNCKILICNDSGPLHVGVGFNKPIVVVFGPTSPALVGPYGRQESVVQPPNIKSIADIKYRRQRNDQTLISTVSVDAVWKKVVQQISKQ